MDDVMQTAREMATDGGYRGEEAEAVAQSLYEQFRAEYEQKLAEQADDEGGPPPLDEADDLPL
jgi:hypothetical protein